MSRLDKTTLNALQLIDYTLKNSPESLSIIPPTVTKVTRQKTLEKGRNGHPGRIRLATMTIAIPDEVARKLKVDEDADAIMIIHIRDAKDLIETANSPIVRP